MKEYLEAARHMALDRIADDNVTALAAASVGAKQVTATHIGQAVIDILELAHIVNLQENTADDT